MEIHIFHVSSQMWVLHGDMEVSRGPDLYWAGLTGEVSRRHWSGWVGERDGQVAEALLWPKPLYKASRDRERGLSEVGRVLVRQLPREEAEDDSDREYKAVR
jgi:hypothetical protein